MYTTQKVISKGWSKQLFIVYTLIIEPKERPKKIYRIGKLGVIISTVAQRTYLHM